MIKLFDKVQVDVKTQFGMIKVDFTVVDVINEPNKIYALIAQKRLVIGQLMSGNEYWRLSDSINLLDIPINQR